MRSDECEVIGLDVIDIHYNNEECAMIIFKNWTLDFRIQSAKAK